MHFYTFITGTDSFQGLEPGNVLNMATMQFMVHQYNFY